MDNNKWPLAKITFIALLCLQVVTVGLILLISHFWSEAAFLKHVRVLMDSVATQSVQSVGHLLEPAERTLELSQLMIESEVISAGDPEKLERYLFETIKQNVDFASIHFAWNNGDSLAISRSDIGITEPPFVSQFIVAEAKPGALNSTSTSRLISFDPVFQSTDSVNYDVRNEAWFQNASDHVPHWTTPGFTQTAPSLMVSVAVYNPSGEKVGVIALGLLVSDLAYYVNKNELSPNSSALVANDENHLISHTDHDAIRRDENDAIETLDDERVTRALNALHAKGQTFVGNGIRRVEYDYEGETYHAVFHSYTGSGLDWTVVIMAPESDFIQGIRTAQNRQLMIVVSVSLLITVIAFMVVLRILRPVDELQESILRNQLTGLYNRRALDTLGNGMIKEARHKKLAISVAMIDIDRFKLINDNYGHPVGDEVLVSISQRMQQVLKKTDILVRYGGEEFALMMFGANQQAARQICERIRKSVASDPVLTDAGAVQVTVSIGVQEIPEDEIEFAPSLNLADQALFVAKRWGRNQVCDPSDLDRPEPTKPLRV